MDPLAIPSPIPELESVAVPLISPIEDLPPDVIPGFVPRRGQLVIAGETDVGKSLVALEICSALSTGLPLWNQLQPTHQARKILYVLGEHYNAVIQRLWAKTRLPMSDQVWIIGPEQLSYDKWLVAQGKPNPVAIEKFRKWTDGCDAIVFDPLSAFVTGIDAENDNVQMRLVLDTMSLIAQGAGAACIVLAHQGKPSMGQNGQEFKRKSYAIRGASAIEDAATNIFYLSHDRGESSTAERLPGDTKILKMECRKYKGEAPPEYRLLRDPGTLCHTLLGNRPFHEVLKLDTLGKVTKLQAALPNITFNEAIKAVASIQNISEDTLRKYLG